MHKIISKFIFYKVIIKNVNAIPVFVDTMGRLSCVARSLDNRAGGIPTFAHD